ncbi:hypothetical protein H8356DRAFT_1291383 [Neocallimastix lanati (nom. inval.)]|uniref:Uncharacterized protein n=1 Tax=Neocallimastix californiae TaxID=1754190 RepID=A0A1Y2BD89_9FUNG|nr:hypothetical protein H8356DRAFT_1291383 [Neocallimastix sp. JGI-2020a]ORY32676.1 hypothetical protein LY90DRAFT_512221 [Neocallimastix californiae]|eukprot:ORY32676.1 hypothetical protein LY90DRAFT_512221 [Neocallimastix californiae]
MLFNKLKQNSNNNIIAEPKNCIWHYKNLLEIKKNELCRNEVNDDEKIFNYYKGISNLPFINPEYIMDIFSLIKTKSIEKNSCQFLKFLEYFYETYLIGYDMKIDSQEESDSEEESTVQKENTNDIIQQQLQDLLKVNDDQYSTQEIECINEVSHYFIDEMFTPDPKYFINGLELQKAIDKLQVAAPWKITKNAEAYVNPVIISNTEKQPMIRLLMLIDSGGSLNLISKKLVELLKLPSKASYQEFSTISGKAKATKKTLISFCCKLADKIRETNNEEFLNAVPQYSTPIS